MNHAVNVTDTDTDAMSDSNGTGVDIGTGDVVYSFPVPHLYGVTE